MPFRQLINPNALPIPEQKPEPEPGDERIILARDLRKTGLTQRQIGNKLGVSQTTIHKWLKEPGGIRLGCKYIKTRGDSDSMLSMLERGFSIKDISRFYEITTGAVTQRIRRSRLRREKQCATAN